MSFPPRNQKKNIRRRKRRRQLGGMLPGLIAALVKAKRQKRNVGSAAGRYLKGAVGRRINVAKVAAGKKVPTPSNTGMSAKKFFLSGLFGLV